ncbi:MAG: GspH/FimT family pseudopilin [Gammaproteobacteria bacterium]|nr:GspH/FimT family pseudopilin [Gammaproteobacteria bacterium]
MDVTSITIPSRSRTCPEPNLQRGYTLVELMLALTIGSILFSMAIPAFGAMMARQRLAVGVDTLFTDLQLSRSEAITRSRLKFICRSQDGENCINIGSWDDGWIVFVDINKNNQRDADEQILRIQLAMHKGININFGSLNSTGIRFKSDGTGTFNGTFTFCDVSGNAAPRAIIFYYSGRPRYALNRSVGSELVCT